MARTRVGSTNGFIPGPPHSGPSEARAPNLPGLAVRGRGEEGPEAGREGAEGGARGGRGRGEEGPEAGRGGARGRGEEGAARAVFSFCEMVLRFESGGT